MSLLIVLLVAGLIGWFLYLLGARAWAAFPSLPDIVAVALVTAFTTVVVSTATVMLGRFFERKKESDALYRDKKIGIYDDFLKKLFEIFLEEKKQPTKSENLVPFLREMQRKMILWAGPKVVRSYVDWITALQTRTNASSVFLNMEQFFLAIRRDLGHTNKGLKEGDFIRFLLRDTDLFLAAIKENPSITLDELIELERVKRS